MVALVVGTILNLINQGDALLGEGHLNFTKLLLTFAVPYCVATYGAVSYRLRAPRR
ncbi:MAG: nitrate/nitrite transporter NrtS [Proteobacteria bacterium]|nr:nitrate/nitrite transporter NrtS [Pseudomonadota bacterium]